MHDKIRDRMHQTKTRYTEKQARNRAEKLEELTGLQFAAYPCDYCDTWHIGKQSIRIQGRKVYLKSSQRS